MEMYIRAWKEYANFSGRASRGEYWTFYIINALIVFVIFMFSDSGSLKSLSRIYEVIIFVPSWAVSVRRLHDINRSGWTLLLQLIPIVGSIWILILLLKKGDKGYNGYGPEPEY